MTKLPFRAHVRRYFGATALAVLSFVALGSCNEEDEPAPDGDGGSAGETGGDGGTSQGGSAGALGGSAGTAGSGATDGGSAGDDSTTGGNGGTATGGAAGDGAAGDAGSGGDGGSAGDGMGACDPASPAGAQGCGASEKCTWLKTSQTTGMLGCAPAGSVAVGGLCDFDAGMSNGASYDGCQAGLVCADGNCREICDFDGGAGSTCASGQACVRTAALFADGNDRPAVGACLATCDPLTQTRIVDGGSTTCGVNQGCYLVKTTVDTMAACAPAGTPGHNQPISGMAYSNSCAPGHTARRIQVGSDAVECTAFCKAADVYSGVNDGVAARPSYEGGDPRSPNWLNLPATCESVGGASIRPEVPSTGESCRYFHWSESIGAVTAFSNSIGWCVPHARWRYDPTGGTNLTTPWPRCPTLTDGDVLPPLNGESDALDWGCKAKPEPSMQALGSLPSSMPDPAGVYLDRIHPNP